mgnify:CR=1 FL=1
MRRFEVIRKVTLTDWVGSFGCRPFLLGEINFSEKLLF